MTLRETYRFHRDGLWGKFYNDYFRTYYGGIFYFEPEWRNLIYLSKEKNFSINSLVGYKIAPASYLTTESPFINTPSNRTGYYSYYRDINDNKVSFDFSGFKFGLLINSPALF